MVQPTTGKTFAGETLAGRVNSTTTLVAGVTAVLVTVKRPDTGSPTPPAEPDAVTFRSVGGASPKSWTFLPPMISVNAGGWAPPGVLIAGPGPGRRRE